MKRVVAVLAVVLLGSLVGSGLMADEHQAVGSEKCAKVCHKVEFKSWSASQHAKAEVKAECETCHGNGKDYMKLSVMKDPAKAEAAGLIAKPGKASCTLECHQESPVSDEMFAEVHEREPPKK
jgi:hypothetical protein